MCGISVIKNLRRERVSTTDLRRMCSVMSHRGPDGGGFAILDQGTLGLAHVRLSVIDLATGTQPLSSADGHVTIVFNGELYDYQQHREALERRGHRFRTTSDTEVLLNLYIEYGTESFSKLNGEFAFVIWDARLQRLVAVRDRFGVKPLFVHQTQDELFFVSEIKSLFALSRVNRAFNPDFFMSAFFGTLTPATHFYEDVHPLPPGHYVCIEQGRWTEPIPYWTPKFETQTAMTLEEAAEGVRERFTRAVSRRLIADVPVGSYLSGGIDSTLVCGVMSQTTSKLRSFNIGFGNTSYDESALARKIARHYGAEFETVDCTSEKLADNFEKTVLHVEQPLMNPNSIAKLILSKLVRDQGYKVCLTGEGADEMFGGYPYFKQELLWEMAKSGQLGDAEAAESLLQKFYEIEKRSEGSHWNRDIKGKGPVPSYLKHANFYYSRMVTSKGFIKKLFHPKLLKTTTVKSPLEYFEKTFDTEALRPLESFNATRLMTYQFLSQYVFPCVGDRVDMANSIECRVPFLDSELVEFVNQIPSKHFMNIRELKEKNLLRVGFRDLLPPFMDSEFKHPFMAPNWHRLSRTPTGRELFSDLLSPTLVREVGVFRQSFVSAAKLLWTLLPQRTTMWRRIDTALGQVLSVHLLHQRMLSTPDSGDPSFQLADCTPA
ncbi:MAG: Asparagine synthetase [Schlesneria sp.]|nr:Asparagine synthetase [Schlesneria sp.]